MVLCFIFFSCRMKTFSNSLPSSLISFVDIFSDILPFLCSFHKSPSCFSFYSTNKQCFNFYFSVPFCVHSSKSMINSLSSLSLLFFLQNTSHYLLRFVFSWKFPIPSFSPSHRVSTSLFFFFVSLY